MATFYLTATSPAGQRETKAVKAKSLADARQKLIDRDWTDIVVHTDDVVAINQIDVPDNPFSPEEMVQLGGMSTFRFFLLMLVKLYRQWTTTSLIACASLVLGIVFYEWWAIILGASLLAIPVRLAMLSAFGNVNKQRYDALVTAAAWYRWDDVERLLPLQSSTIPPEERAYRAGQILAGRGDIQGAIERYESLTARHNVPQWFAESRKAVLCVIANKFDWKRQAENGTSSRLQSPLIDEALRHYASAVELAPEQAVTRVDYAKFALKYRRDVRIAREMLDAVARLPSAELALFFADYVKGIIAIEENAPEEAIQLIREFQQKLSPMSSNADVVSGIDEASMFLTLAYAAAGKEEKALREFKRCEPRMKALNEVEMLSRCRQALGLNQG